MLSPVLRKVGENRMVYSTSLGFRLLFLTIALLIFTAVFISSRGAIFRKAHIATLALCAVCLVSSLYLERWVFDREANHFENNVGLVFLYARKTRTLDSLQSVVLNDSMQRFQADRRRRSMMPRRSVVLYVRDCQDNVFKLDMGSRVGIRTLKDTAEKLADFCRLPLEDHLGGA